MTSIAARASSGSNEIHSVPIRSAKPCGASSSEEAIDGARYPGARVGFCAVALNDEQRSLLQLLLGGQSYEDIGSLLGTDAAQVRVRAREALTEVGGADPDAKVGLTDFLLGKADPIGRADAVRQLQNDPESNELATEIVSRLRLLSPSAQLPEIPPAKGGRRAAAPSPTSPTQPASPAGDASKSRRPGVPDAIKRMELGDDRRRLAIVAAGVGALILAVILAVVVFGGGDDDGGEGGADTETALGGDEELLIVSLGPLGEGGAAGQAVFAQAQDQPLLQINLTGLPPAGQNQNYIAWLYNSDRFAFPLARDRVGQDGNLTGTAAVPTQILPLLNQGLFGCVDVSLASNEQTQAALQSAANSRQLPAHTGESVLRGQIPTAPGEEAPSGADSVCDAASQAGAGAGGQAQGDSGLGGRHPRAAPRAPRARCPKRRPSQTGATAAACPGS